MQRIWVCGSFSCAPLKGLLFRDLEQVLTIVQHSQLKIGHYRRLTDVVIYFTNITRTISLQSLHLLREHPLRTPRTRGGATTMGTWGGVKVNKDIPKTQNFLKLKLAFSATHALFIFEMCWILLIKTISEKLVDGYDLLIYKVKRPICITLSKCFLKIMGCPFGERGSTERDMGREVKNVHFIGNVLNGCSLMH